MMIAVGWRIKCFWGRFSDANSPHIHSLTDSTFPAQNRQEFEFPLLLSLLQRHSCVCTLFLLLAVSVRCPPANSQLIHATGKEVRVGEPSQQSKWRTGCMISRDDWLQSFRATDACAQETTTIQAIHAN